MMISSKSITEDFQKKIKKVAFYPGMDYKETMSSSLWEAISQITSEITLNADVSNGIYSNQSFDQVVTIGLAGGVQGFYFLSSDNDSSMEFWKKLLACYGMTEDDGVSSQSVLSEFANQTAGRLINILDQKGIEADITPPTILKGNNVCFQTQNLDQSECVILTHNNSKLTFSAIYKILSKGSRI